MVEAGLVALLNSESSVTTLVGNSIRSFPAPVDLDDYPCITYQLISYTTGYTTQASIGLAHKRIVLNCWARDYLTAHNILEAVRGVLSGYQGTLDGAQVYLIEVVNEDDGFNQNDLIYKASLHVMVHYAE